MRRAVLLVLIGYSFVSGVVLLAFDGVAEGLQWFLLAWLMVLLLEARRNG